MKNENEKFGTVYGELVPVEDDNLYLDQVESDFIRNIRELGVKMFITVEDERWNGTIYMEAFPDTDFRAMMLQVVTQRPHEFSEESPFCFRMWFD